MKRTPHSIVFMSGAVLANGLLFCVFVVGPARVLQDEAALRKSAAARRAPLTVSVLEQPYPNPVHLNRVVFSVPQAPQTTRLVGFRGAYGENSVLQAGTVLHTSRLSETP